LGFFFFSSVLHAGGNQLALSTALGVPATSEGSVAQLLLVLLDAGLQLGAEVTDQTLDGPGEGLTQSANSVTLNLLGELLEHVDLTLAGVANLHALHHLLGPLATLTAGGALTARLVAVERGETGDSAHNVGGLIHDDDGGGTQTSLGVLKGVEVHKLVVGDRLRNNGSRRTAGNDGI
jgi:hypothetical protein